MSPAASEAGGGSPAWNRPASASGRVSPLGGRRPRRDELAQFEGGSVDDVVHPDPWLLIVGINPGLWTAAVNAPFAAPSNRFWTSLHQAGLMPHRVDATAGLSAEDEAEMVARGIGLTNLVNRATARAAELSREELREGGRRLVALAQDVRPDVVAILGVTAYRDAFDQPKAQMGQQFYSGVSGALGSSGASGEPGEPVLLGGGELWVLPQPSGLNAHAPIPVLVDWWRQVAQRRRSAR